MTLSTARAVELGAEYAASFHAPDDLAVRALKLLTDELDQLEVQQVLAQAVRVTSHIVSQCASDVGTEPEALIRTVRDEILAGLDGRESPGGSG